MIRIRGIGDARGILTFVFVFWSLWYKKNVRKMKIWERWCRKRKTVDIRRYLKIFFWSHQPIKMKSLPQFSKLKQSFVRKFPSKSLIKSLGSASFQRIFLLISPSMDWRRYQLWLSRECNCRMTAKTKCKAL